MTMIKIIKDLDITASGVSVFNRKWQPVHLQQGEMDGACAVYSMMMNLLILKVLTRNQVVNLKTTFKEIPQRETFQRVLCDRRTVP